MNGGLHIKQESVIVPEPHGSREVEQIHHVIKREIHSSEYDDMDQEGASAENMAEDLTVASDHTDPNVMDA